MKLAWIALAAALAACSGSSTPPTSPQAVVSVFPAARWVPASPAYVVAAPTFADAQHSIRDAIDGLGMVGGISAADAGSHLARFLAVDPLDENAVAAIGVDVHGGVVMFSEDIAPTFVVHLSAPEQMQAFLDRQRERGLVSRSVIVDGTEIFTAEIDRNYLDLSWAIADGWLWLHFTPRFARNEGTAWFTNSRKPASTEWTRDWEWAQSVATGAKGLVGFVDPKDFLGRFGAHIPEALACTRLLEPIQRVGFAIDASSSGTASGRLTLDLGPAAAQVVAATKQVPEGFSAVAANAPISVQWNLDLVALRTWAAPCLETVNGDLRAIDRYGVRAGRAVVQSVNIDDKSGAGVVSLDLLHKKFLANALDDIPMRSTIEKDRMFGPVPGHTVAIPFVATVDYALSDTQAYVAMGDGVLAKTIGTGKTVPGPLAAIDILPPRLSPETWTGLFELVDIPASYVARLLAWRDAHVSLSIEGSSLVLAASGTRR